MKGARSKVEIIKNILIMCVHNEIRRVSWMLLDPRMILFCVELIFAFVRHTCICTSRRSLVAMSGYVCIRGGGGRNGKLNQRISRIYRRAIPGYCKCTVSVTSCRIFLRNPVVAFPLFLSFSPAYSTKTASWEKALPWVLPIFRPRFSVAS